MKNLFQLNKVLSNKQKKQFSILIFLILFSTLLEIGLLKFVFILLNYFTNPLIEDNSSIFNFIQSINLDLSFHLKVILMLLLLYFLKTSTNLFINWKKGNFVFKTKENLSRNFLKGYLFMPRIFHMRTNTAELVKNVTTEVDSVMGSLLGISNVILESILLTGMIIFLCFLNFKLTIICLILFIIFFLLISRFNSEKTIKLGRERVTVVQNRLQNILEALTGSKTYTMTGKRDNAMSVFDNNNIKFRKISVETYFRNTLPKPLFELFTVSVITLFFLVISKNNISLQSILPTLGVFLAASYRLIPSFSNILSSLQGYQYSIQAINNLSKDNLKFKKNIYFEGKKINFKNEIEFKNLSFSYDESSNPNKNLILENLNIKIKKGDKIGIIGKSGSGKSTFLDIFMGLLTSYKGEILVDGINIKNYLSGWQKNIGCVPQDVFILDDTLKKNIAFGLDEKSSDILKIKETIDLAGLNEFVNQLPFKLDTIIGEKGDRISGGQKQRVGIARSLYFNPDILVLDEATSALDENTEKIIIKDIFEKNNQKTIIFVSHNLDNLIYCNSIYEIESKKVNKIK